MATKRDEVLALRQRAEAVLQGSLNRSVELELSQSGLSSDHKEKLFEKHGQTHLLRFWPDESTSDEDIDALDMLALKTHLQQLERFFGSEGMQVTNIFHDSLHLSSAPPSLRAPPAQNLITDVTQDVEGTRTLEHAGLSEIASGRVVVVVLAGGSGTRLGVSFPKGLLRCPDLVLRSQHGPEAGKAAKSLFELQCDRIGAMQRVVHSELGLTVQIPIVFMTSPQTDAQTRQFFTENNFFGLAPGQVHFCTQSTMPCFDSEGRVLLSEPFKIAEAPGGNAGIYQALAEGDLMDLLKKGSPKKELLLQVVTVDNILAKLADPVMVGMATRRSSDSPLEVVVKTTPKASDTEAVGVIALRAYPSDALEAETWQNKNPGVAVDRNPLLRWGVLEYTEIGQELASKRRDPTDEKSGRLFDCANIAIHLFSEGFVRRAAEAMRSSFSYYHVARKPIVRSSTVSEDGNLSSSSSGLYRLLSLGPEALAEEGTFFHQGIKLEAFIFDLFKFVSDMTSFGILSVKREEEFSAIKNADDAVVDVFQRGFTFQGKKKDSPQSAVVDLHNLHLRMIIDADEGKELHELLLHPALGGGAELHQVHAGSLSSVRAWLASNGAQLKTALASRIAEDSDEKRVSVLVVNEDGSFSIETPQRQA